jgi:DNA-binding LytR/AlgR family response regulator
MRETKLRIDRFVVHASRSRRLLVTPHSIYYAEADGPDTVLRLRGRRTLRDVRTLKQLTEALRPFAFHRVHDKWLVNVRRIREIRLQRDGRDWEVVMQPPVNHVIPVSRSRHAALMRLLET